MKKCIADNKKYMKKLKNKFFLVKIKKITIILFFNLILFEIKQENERNKNNLILSELNKNNEITKNKENILIDSNNTYDIVIPLGKNYIKEIFEMNIKQQKKLFNSKIIIIGNQMIKEDIRKSCNDCEFINENNLYEGLTIQKIKEFKNAKYWLKSYYKWYFQQFIKMAFAFISKHEYYLIFDYDTIPINRFSLFNITTNKPFFSYSCDSWRKYFITMKKLFKYEKEYNYSYVCEHMMINKNIMIELIKTIEGNSNLEGEYFYEKILYASNGEEVGFSEYETYGTYVYNYFPDLYEYRHLRKSDNSPCIFSFDEKIIEYAAQYYDTLRFEKLPKTNSRLYRKMHNEKFRKRHKIYEIFPERNYITTCKFITKEEN